LTLVVGARANTPKPVVPPEIRGLVVEAAKQSSRIQVIRIDGAPSVALDAMFRTNGKNDEIRQRELDNFTARTLAVVSGLKPKVPEADVLGALTAASHATPEGGTIVLLDSGLATKGQLSFLDSDMFGARSDDAVKYLQSQHLMPNLTGRSMVLAGLGLTADPQPPLDENLRTRVNALWHAIAAKAGAACVHDLDTADRRPSVDTNIQVTLVQLPPTPSFTPCGTTVLADSDTVGFLPDKAIFRDPSAARATLQDLADQLRNGKQRVTLTGTTATDGTEQYRNTLSLLRAGAVKDVLVSLGVAADQITPVGAGSHGPNHINDLAADGSLLPGPAAHNRSVVVTLACLQT
jgi:outer membrane protein OmpA-like peptidoglycan-associated protein